MTRPLKEASLYHACLEKHPGSRNRQRLKIKYFHRKEGLPRHIKMFY